MNLLLKLAFKFFNAYLQLLFLGQETFDLGLGFAALVATAAPTLKPGLIEQRGALSTAQVGVKVGNFEIFHVLEATLVRGGVS